jgi:hypothetical protein
LPVPTTRETSFSTWSGARRHAGLSSLTREKHIGEPAAMGVGLVIGQLRFGDVPEGSG